MNGPLGFVKENAQSWQFGGLGGTLPCICRTIQPAILGLVERQRYLYGNMKLIFFSILTALAFWACSTPEMPKKRSLQAYVRYLDDTKRLRAEATFSEANPHPQPVEMPDGVMFQGIPMKLRPLQGITYQTEYPAAHTQKYKFGWQDGPNQRQELELEMLPITRFRFDQEPISVRTPNTFRWDGGQVQPGEVMVFLWEHLDTRETVKMEIVQQLAGSEIKFPAVKLSELKPGKWTLYLVRKRLRKTTVGQVEASGITEFYSKTDTIEVRS